MIVNGKVIQSLQGRELPVMIAVAARVCARVDKEKHGKQGLGASLSVGAQEQRKRGLPGKGKDETKSNLVVAAVKAVKATRMIVTVATKANNHDARGRNLSPQRKGISHELNNNRRLWDAEMVSEPPRNAVDLFAVAGVGAGGAEDTGDLQE